MELIDEFCHSGLPLWDVVYLPRLVLHQGRCYYPENCPCAWLGLEYLPGETVETPCHKWYVPSHPPKSPECAGISESFQLMSGCSSHQRVSSWLFQLHLLPMSSCVHDLQWQTLPHVWRPGVWLPHRLPGLFAQSESAFSNRCRVLCTFECLCGSERGSECFPGTLLSRTCLWMIEELSSRVCGHASKHGAML